MYDQIRPPCRGTRRNPGKWIGGSIVACLEGMIAGLKAATSIAYHNNSSRCRSRRR